MQFYGFKIDSLWQFKYYIMIVLDTGQMYIYSINLEGQYIGAPKILHLETYHGQKNNHLMSLEAIHVVIHQTMNKLGGSQRGVGGGVVLNFKERYPEKNYVLSNSKKIVPIYQRMYKFLERFVKFIGKQASLKFQISFIP